MADIDWENGVITPPAATDSESIDWESGEISAPREPKGVVGHVRDLGLSAVKSAIAVPEAAVGIADIATRGRVGKALENKDGAIGFRPREARDFLSSLHTDQYKEQQKEFSDADGVIDKAAVALKNPSLIANTVVESAAPMLAGGVAARGLATVAPKVAPVLAAAAGEGVVAAGGNAENMRQESADGELTTKQSLGAAATGGTTALFGYAGGRLAQKLGIGDIDTMLARGIKPTDIAGDLAKASAKSIPRQIIEGAISEGFLEELPQSVSEQIIQNLSSNKPWSEGVEDAAVMGTLAGMVMGGPAAGVAAVGRNAEQSAEQLPAEIESQAIDFDHASEDQTNPYDDLPPVMAESTENVADIEPIVQPVRREAPTRSQQMGLDPEAGPMSAAAALAVDTGAHDDALAQAAEIAQANESEKTNAPTEKTAQQDVTVREPAREPLAPAGQRGRSAEKTEQLSDDELIARMTAQFDGGNRINSVDFAKAMGIETTRAGRIRARVVAENQAKQIKAENDAILTTSYQSELAAKRARTRLKGEAKNYEPVKVSDKHFELRPIVEPVAPQGAGASISPSETEANQNAANENATQESSIVDGSGSDAPGEIADAEGSGGSAQLPLGREGDSSNSGQPDSQPGAAGAVSGAGIKGGNKRAADDSIGGVHTGIDEASGRKRAADSVPINNASDSKVSLADALVGEYRNADTTDATAKVSKTKNGYQVEWAPGDVKQFNGKNAAERVQAALKRKKFERADEETIDAALADRRNEVIRNQIERDLGSMTPAQMQEEIVALRTETLIDSLTGLGNRKAWSTREREAFVGAIDVDSLKWVNDNMGHQAGDELLVVVAKALNQSGLKAFHVSGDEYWVSGNDAAELKAGLESALSALSNEFSISGNGLEFNKPTFSYGIAATEADAERGLHDHKSEREGSGQRAARGEQPQGVSSTDSAANEGRNGKNESDPISANAQERAGSVSPEITSIDAAANEAATSPQNDLPEPTDAQKEAGNYKLGHIKVHGLDISIENPKGSTRSGTREDGSTWSHEMSDHYGYIKRTEGADGDHVDVYVGPKPESNRVFVVDQLNQKNGKFDEHKVMLGFSSQMAAVRAYKSNFDKGWKVGPVTAMSIDEFKEWLKGDTSKPIAAPTKAASQSVPTKPAQQTADKPISKNIDAAPTAEKIEDFGEKIGGARKDIWSGFRDNISTPMADDWKTSPLSKIFPEPNYKALAKEGVSTETLASLKVIREAIPPKPRDKFKLSRWGSSVATLRDVANSVLENKMKVADINEAIPNFKMQVDALVSLGFPEKISGLQGYQLAKHNFTMVNGIEYPQGVDKYTVERRGGLRNLYQPISGAYYDTETEAVERLRKELGIESGSKAARTTKLDIYRVTSTGDIVIGKKVSPNKYIDLKTGFRGPREARDYLGEHYDELLAELERKKDVPPERKSTNDPRVGEDYRQGENIAPNDFQKTFGFRGVQFGNYVEGKRRQSDLNNAYDSLRDLADLINIPSQAVSLNGDLGLAFGARGSGGKNAAAAHYESDNVVINLTKNNGHGSLAHEWWHALDNYFSRMAGKKDGMMSLSRSAPDGTVRPEMVEAYKHVVDTIKATELPVRSRNLDNTRTKDYWSTTHEMTARAFESYVIEKAREQSKSNDYLANIVPPLEFLFTDNSYPYIEENELPKIVEAFDKFFATIKTKKTDTGTALYRRTSYEPKVVAKRKGMLAEAVQRSLRASTSNWSNAPKIETVQSIDDLPPALRVRVKRDGALDAEGAYYDGKVYLVADNLGSMQHAAYVVAHEVLGHAGLQGAFNLRLTPMLSGIYRDDAAIRSAADWLIDKFGYSKAVAVEEVLADMAAAGRLEQQPFWQRLVTAVRSALRGIGFDLKWSDADINGMLANARRYIEGGSRSTPQAENSDARYSRAAMGDIVSKATSELNKTFNAPGKLSWWHKTVGSMYNLAERSPAFKPVFEAAQSFIEDVSYYAADAAEKAPKILPKLEDFRDLLKSPVSAADNEAIAKPIFEGTLMWARDANGKPARVESLTSAAAKLSPEQKAQALLAQGKVDQNMLKAWQGMSPDRFAKMVDARYESQLLKPGIVWSDAELKTIFNLNESQIELYHEFREATNRSLDTMARADMLRFGGEDVKDIRDEVMDAPTVRDAAIILAKHLKNRANDFPDRAQHFANLAHGMKERADKVEALKAEGYAPLSRFGKYTVDVVEDGERQYFGLFETAREANQMAEKMRAEFGANSVSQGTLSDESFKLFAGITPESLELFGNMLGLDSTGDSAQDQAFQQYLRLTKTNRSAMRRLIHRKGISGFSEDVGRVLASFVYSNARQTAAGLHMGDLGDAVSAIPKEQGELKDVAVRLSEYVKNPQEEAQAIRGLLFAQYLGGSVASAVVNMTQPIAVTFPWLSRYGGAAKAAAEISRAAKNMATKGFKYEADLATALKAAEADGVVSPQEVHQLMAQARGSGSLRSGDGTRIGDARAMAQNSVARMSVAWGKLFGAAEQLNRRVTFIASYRVAKANGIDNPAEFARQAVKETQFVYSKASKMHWGRGAIGGTLMTFKTYSIAYLELMHRLWNQGEKGSIERKEGRKAVALMVATLILMSGAGGLPFADDAEDIIDGAAQLLGYNFSLQQAREEFLQDVFGETAANFIEKGITGLPGSPLDVSGRMGMGNLIPGTGLLREKADHTRDVMEILGPAGDLASRVGSGASKLLHGDVVGGLLDVSPTAVRNLAKGADMAATGAYRDQKGYKVLETNNIEAALKAIGFQSADVARVQQANALNQGAKAFYNKRAQEIRAMWAAGIYEKDPAKVQGARDAITEWNEKNPDQRMTIKITDVMRRAREMAKSKDERIAATAPRAMRAQMKQESSRLHEALD